MNWVKAKNITIIAFILLNIILILLRYIDNRRYILSSSQQAAVITILNNNNITLLDNFVFPRHYPKGQISLISIPFNQNNMVNIFMRDNKDTTLRVEDNLRIYENYNERVTFEGSKIIYENLGNTELYIADENDANVFSSQLIRNLGQMGSDFTLDRTLVTESEIILEYRQNYRNHILFSNYIIFTFENSTIKTIEFSYYDTDGFTGNTREVSSADEVLITFMREVRLLHQCEEEVHIEKIDLVYKQTESNLHKTTSVAVPYYRIYYYINGDLNVNPNIMLINAYNNMAEI